MEEIIGKIKEYKTEPNNGESEEIMVLFGKLIEKKCSANELVDPLLEFAPYVTKIFLERHYERLVSQELLSPFLKKYRKSKKITPSTIPNRIFPIVGFISFKGNSMSSVAVFFLSFLEKIDKKGSYSENTLKLFNKHVLQYYNESPYDFLKLDYGNVDANLLVSLNRFVIGLAEAEMIDLANENVIEWADKYNVRLPKRKVNTQEQAKADLVLNENPVQEKKISSIKEEKKSPQEKITKDSPKSLPVPENTPVVATIDKKEKTPTEEPKMEKVHRKKQSDAVEETSFNQNMDYSLMLTEIQEAQKSLLATVAVAENSVGKMSESLSDSLGMIDTQREEIAQLKGERAILEEQKCGFDEKLKTTSQQLTDASAEIVSLKKKIAFLEEEVSAERVEKQSLVESEKYKIQQLEEQTSKITDLEQRLKKSLEQDAIAENQELITLRKELSRKLQEAHKDYGEMAMQDYSSDLLESHKFLLERIFKMFKRHGINWEEEG